jgi:hypothetical protein
MDEKRRREIVSYLLVWGVWCAVAIALYYSFIVFSDVELLKSDPCRVCEEVYNYSCNKIDLYSTWRW